MGQSRRVRTSWRNTAFLAPTRLAKDRPRVTSAGRPQERRREGEGDRAPLPEARDALDELLELNVVCARHISRFEPVGPVIGPERQAVARQVVQELTVFEAEGILAAVGVLVWYEGDTVPGHDEQSAAAPQAMLMHDT